jgi:hypothetical protein
MAISWSIVMKNETTIKSAVSVTLTTDVKYLVASLWLAALVPSTCGMGLFADTTDAKNEVRVKVREELFVQLCTRDSKDAAAMSRLNKAQWDDLSGTDRKAMQAIRTRIKTQVDNRWLRMKLAVRQSIEEQAAAESGEPTAKAKKTLIERFTDFEVAATKGNKKAPEIGDDILAALLATWRADLQEFLKKA